MEKIIAEITSSASIVGKVEVCGSIVGDIGQVARPYTGEYNVVPKPFEQQVLPTANKMMKNDVTIVEIPYFEVSNTLGETVYIGKELNNGN